MKITPTHRRLALLVFVSLTAFGGGAAVMDLTTQPEVITVSQDVPTACSDAAQFGFDQQAADLRVDQYQAKAEVLAGEVTSATVSAEADKLEQAFAPIAEHNANEAEARTERDAARAEFEQAANECLAKAAAAEAAHDR